MREFTQLVKKFLPNAGAKNATVCDAKYT